MMDKTDCSRFAGLRRSLSTDYRIIHNAGYASPRWLGINSGDGYRSSAAIGSKASEVEHYVRYPTFPSQPCLFVVVQLERNSRCFDLQPPYLGSHALFSKPWAESSPRRYILLAFTVSNAGLNHVDIW